MPKFHTLVMQVSKNTYLFGELGNQIRHLYSELKVMKVCGERGFSLSQHHFIAEATSPVRSDDKEQEQKLTTPAHSEQ
jgi:hypothetical protein